MPNPPKPNLPALAVSWSNPSMVGGQVNQGTLQLSSATVGTSISLNKGDAIVLSGLPEEWTVALEGADQWRMCGNTMTWQGSGPYIITKDPSGISLNVTPPANALHPWETINVYAMTASGQRLSQTFSIVFSQVTPGQPASALAQGSAIALISWPELAFQNILSSSILATSAPTPPRTVQINLSFHAYDGDNNEIDITQEIKSTLIEVNATVAGSPVQFSHNADNSWSAKTTSWGAGVNAALNVVVQGLSFHDPNIRVVELAYLLTGLADNAYVTSAFFNAAGPFSVGVSIDPGAAKPLHFNVTPAGTGSFNVNYLVLPAEQPPLVFKLLDTSGQETIPPIPGSFSWKSTEIYFPTDYRFAENNVLYWVSSTPQGIQSVCSSNLALTQLTTASAAPVYFAGLSMPGSDFTTWTNLDGADFSNTDLSGASFAGKTVNNVSFKSAILHGCNFQGATFTPTNFSGLDLSGANLSGAMLKGCLFTGANLSKAQVNGAVLTGTDFTGANLQGLASGALDVQLPVPDGWFLIKGCLVGPSAILDNSDLSGVDFSHFQLANCSFIGANLANAKFDGAHLEGCNFSGANLNGATFIGASLSQANMSKSSLGYGFETPPKAPGDYPTFTYYFTDFGNANLSNANLSNLNSMLIIIRSTNFEGVTFTDDLVGNNAVLPYDNASTLPAGWTLEYKNYACSFVKSASD